MQKTGASHLTYSSCCKIYQTHLFQKGGLFKLPQPCALFCANMPLLLRTSLANSFTLLETFVANTAASHEAFSVQAHFETVTSCHFRSSLLRNNHVWHRSLLILDLIRSSAVRHYQLRCQAGATSSLKWSLQSWTQS